MKRDPLLGAPRMEHMKSVIMLTGAAGASVTGTRALNFGNGLVSPERVAEWLNANGVQAVAFSASEWGDYILGGASACPATEPPAIDHDKIVADFGAKIKDRIDHFQLSFRKALLCADNFMIAAVALCHLLGEQELGLKFVALHQKFLKDGLPAIGAIVKRRNLS